MAGACQHVQQTWAKRGVVWCHQWSHAVTLVWCGLRVRCEEGTPFPCSPWRLLWV